MIQPSKTVVVTVDMWDNHWCKTFAQWTNECAIRLNPFLDKVRSHGVQVIHMAADVADKYTGDPRREKIRTPKHSEPDMVSLEPSPPGRWPVTGCCCDSLCDNVVNWSRLNPNLVIADNDLIGDSDDLLAYCERNNVSWIYYTGTATNMCVLDMRSFSMVQMRAKGFNVRLVADMTEAFVTGVPREIGLIRSRAYITKHIETVTDSYELLENNATV